ncbi:MAG: glycosyltransferase family 9 protein [Syntrophobacteraceae bacterium]
MKGKKAVVFHQGALGDFLVAAGAVDELAHVAGFTCIDFWSKSEHVSLLAERSYLGRCRPCDSPLAAALLAEDSWRGAIVPDFLLEADSIFIFGQTSSRLMAKNLSRLLSADVHWIESFPGENAPREHVRQFLRKQFVRLGLPIEGKPLSLTPSASHKEAALDQLCRLGLEQRPVFIHPGSGGRRKVWPLAKWRGLIDWARRELSAQVLLSIGPADAYIDELAEAVRPWEIPVVSGLSLPGLSALLCLCALYIGSDSGVSHLAAAVGVPTLAIFGPTDPCIWAPGGKRAKAVQRKWDYENQASGASLEKESFEDEEIAHFLKNNFDRDRQERS